MHLALKRLSLWLLKMVVAGLEVDRVLVVSMLSALSWSRDCRPRMPRPTKIFLRNYASIMLDAYHYLLCSILCKLNPRKSKHDIFPVRTNNNKHRLWGHKTMLGQACAHRAQVEKDHKCRHMWSRWLGETRRLPYLVHKNFQRWIYM